MTIDRTTLINRLQAAMDDYLSGSAGVTDVLAASLTAWSLGEINNVVVSNVNFLPNLEYLDSPDAMLCFVQDMDVFVISSNKRWLTLDGRLVRDDTGIQPTQIWSWGLNVCGSLADGTTIQRSSPVLVVGGFMDWCDVSLGTVHGVAIRSSGTSWAWGYNYLGVLLGDGTATNRSSPVSVLGGITDWCQVDAGAAHNMANRASGTAWAWGRNAFGRLGDGTTSNRASPVSVVGGITNWCHLSTSSNFTLGLTATGRVWAWGRNNRGQLGELTFLDQSSPVSVTGGFCDWCQISAGYEHSAAVRASGTAWAWGDNSTGKLGIGTATGFYGSPRQVSGYCTDWCSISAGCSHTIGIKSNGSLWSWGANAQGQLGDGTTNFRITPLNVSNTFTDWCQASINISTTGGNIHSLAIRTNGTAWAWGSNNAGQLGDGTTTNRSSPVSVTGGFNNWCAVSAGGCHSAGLRVF